MRQGILLTVTNLWKHRKKRKAYHRIRLFWSLYLIIFAVILMKDIAGGLVEAQALDVLKVVNRPAGALGAGWLFSILLQSGSVVAIIVSTLLGSQLIDFPSAFFVLVGCILGNSTSPIFASLIVQHDKHWELRHGVEIGVANVVYSFFLGAAVVALELLTGLFTHFGQSITHTLRGWDLLARLPNLLDVIVLPVYEVTQVSSWPIPLQALLALVAVIYGFQILGRAAIRLLGGAERAQKKLETSLHSPARLFGLGIGLTILVPSSSLLVSLMVPLAVSGVLSLRQAIPVLIGSNIATFIDVLLAALANGQPQAIGGALMLMAISLSGLALLTPQIGLPLVNRMTRYLAMNVIPMRKKSIALLLILYTLIPFLLIAF